MDFPILRYLDILVGLAVVMLLGSTVVTAVTQVYLSGSAARSRHLAKGLRDLIGQLDPETLGPHAAHLAEQVLRHPLTSRRGSPADVMQREELVLLLLDWASTTTGHDPARPALIQALQKLGIADAAATAKNIRERMLDHEQAAPQLAAHVRRATAVIEAAKSDLVGKIYAWFDNSMDRVRDYFTLEAKLASSLVALVLCLAFQLDTVALLKRLYSDNQLRLALVAQAAAVQQRHEAAASGAQMDPRQLLAELQQTQFGLPQPRLAFPPAQSLPGIVLSWILLSLGGSFWYNALKRLLAFRSSLLERDDAERAARKGTSS
jgi:hypothetical protein